MLLRADIDGHEAEVEAPGHLVHSSALQQMSDMMDLGDYTEPCLLHTVRCRYNDAANKLYT